MRAMLVVAKLGHTVDCDSSGLSIFINGASIKDEGIKGQSKKGINQPRSRNFRSVGSRLF